MLDDRVRPTTLASQVVQVVVEEHVMHPGIVALQRTHSPPDRTAPAAVLQMQPPLPSVT